MPKYFIYWKSLLTNYISHGQSVCTPEQRVPNELGKPNKLYSNVIIPKYVPVYEYKKNFRGC